MDDYRVKITINNNLLWTAMTGAGHHSIRSLARACGVAAETIASYLSLKLTPVSPSTGRTRSTARKLTEYFDCGLMDLFPPQHLSRPLPTNSVVGELSFSDVANILAYHDHATPESLMIGAEDHAEVLDLDSALALLTPREESVLRHRYSFHTSGREYGAPKTLLQTAGILSVSPQRIRQIEAKAFRKLRSKFPGHLLASGDCVSR